MPSSSEVIDLTLDDEEGDTNRGGTGGRGDGERETTARSDGEGMTGLRRRSEEDKQKMRKRKAERIVNSNQKIIDLDPDPEPSSPSHDSPSGHDETRPKKKQRCESGSSTVTPNASNGSGSQAISGSTNRTAKAVDSPQFIAISDDEFAVGLPSRTNPRPSSQSRTPSSSKASFVAFEDSDDDLPDLAEILGSQASSSTPAPSATPGKSPVLTKTSGTGKRSQTPSKSTTPASGKAATARTSTPAVFSNAGNGATSTNKKGGGKDSHVTSSLKKSATPSSLKESTTPSSLKKSATPAAGISSEPVETTHPRGSAPTTTTRPAHISAGQRAAVSESMATPSVKQFGDVSRSSSTAVPVGAQEPGSRGPVLAADRLNSSSANSSSLRLTVPVATVSASPSNPKRPPGAEVAKAQGSAQLEAQVQSTNGPSAHPKESTGAGVQPRKGLETEENGGKGNSEKGEGGGSRTSGERPPTHAQGVEGDQSKDTALGPGLKKQVEPHGRSEPTTIQSDADSTPKGPIQNGSQGDIPDSSPSAMKSTNKTKERKRTKEPKNSQQAGPEFAEVSKDGTGSGKTITATEPKSTPNGHGLQEGVDSEKKKRKGGNKNAINDSEVQPKIAAGQGSKDEPKSAKAKKTARISTDGVSGPKFDTPKKGKTGPKQTTLSTDYFSPSKSNPTDDIQATPSTLSISSPNVPSLPLPSSTQNGNTRHGAPSNSVTSPGASEESPPESRSLAPPTPSTIPTASKGDAQDTAQNSTMPSASTSSRKRAWSPPPQAEAGPGPKTQLHRDHLSQVHQDYLLAKELENQPPSPKRKKRKVVLELSDDEDGSDSVQSPPALSSSKPKGKEPLRRSDSTLSRSPGVSVPPADAMQSRRSSSDRASQETSRIDGQLSASPAFEDGHLSQSSKRRKGRPPLGAIAASQRRQSHLSTSNTPDPPSSEILSKGADLLIPAEGSTVAQMNAYGADSAVPDESAGVGVFDTEAQPTGRHSPTPADMDATAQMVVSGTDLAAPEDSAQAHTPVDDVGAQRDRESRLSIDDGPHPSPTRIDTLYRASPHVMHLADRYSTPERAGAILSRLGRLPLPQKVPLQNIQNTNLNPHYRKRIRAPGRKLQDILLAKTAASVTDKTQTVCDSTTSQTQAISAESDGPSAENLSSSAPSKKRGVRNPKFNPMSLLRPDERPLTGHAFPDEFSCILHNMMNAKHRTPHPDDTKIFADMIREVVSLEEPWAPNIAVLTPENPGDPFSPPFEFVYTNRLIYTTGVPGPIQSKGCNCVGGCKPDDESCSCHQRQTNALGEYPEVQGFSYDSKGLLIKSRVGYPIWECNRACKCGPECINRVAGRGRRVGLDLFYTGHRGWGVRLSPNMPVLKPGQFICTYSGEMVTSERAEKRGLIYDKEGRTYLFDLDFWHIGKVNKELDKTGLVILHGPAPPNPSTANAVPVANSRVASGVEGNNQHAEQEDDNESVEALYAVDAFSFGNITRFLNHSCDPNLQLIPCYIDDGDITKPLLAIFSMKKINPGDELTISYTGPPDDEDEEQLEIQPDPEPAPSDDELDGFGRKKRGRKKKKKKADTPRGTKTKAEAKRALEEAKVQGKATVAMSGGAAVHPATASSVRQPCMCGAKNCKGFMFSY